MKFIPKKNAPDFPLELIEAQENQDLVFFCGAGVSYPAGLPTFSGLVDNIYVGLGEVQDDLEKQAINERLYDRALGLLESRLQGNESTGINLVRLEIIKQLEISKGANLNTHKAILELAKTKNNRYRLVTTNVDDGFMRAGGLDHKYVDSAPTLPVPKSHKWESIVHLHGVIDQDTDPNGEHLVFTSGDFGSAYLTERWASKFVTDLFMNFTVVFVGYSINDPVIRYMTDAIAAERKFSNKRFKLPYVIADTGKGSLSQAKKNWLAKGVEPILYTADDEEHSNLHESLIEWANYSNDGLNSKLSVVQSSARISPKYPYDQDEKIRHIIDIIGEKVNRNDPNIDGHFAKRFSELDPPPPVDWLKVLDDEGLLALAVINPKVSPVSSSTYQSNNHVPNKISWHLWQWLLNHLQTDELVYWAINRGSDLHPDLKQSIKWTLEKEDVKQPYFKFWSVLSSSKVRRERISRRETFELIKAFSDGDYLALTEFKKQISPFFEVRKNIAGDWFGEEASEITPYSLDVSINVEKYEFQQIKELDGYPYRFTGLLETVSSSLLEAMQLLEYDDQANEKQDRSNWIMVSIEEHSQNTYSKNLSILICLCRDLWYALYCQNPAKAKAVLATWSEYKYPIFKRLTMYAYTRTDAVSADSAVDYLLSDNALWLWSSVTKREVFRLLNRVWPNVSDKKAKDFLGVICEGPPRTMYSGLSDEKFDFRRDHSIWLKLGKLNTFGRVLFGDAKTFHGQLSSKYPQWQLQQGERDEFTHWHSVSSGYDIDISQQELFKLPVKARITLLQKDDRFHEGRLHLLRMADESYADKVVSTLKTMFYNRNWDHKIWHAGLGSASDFSTSHWSKISLLLNLAPIELYKSEGHAIAWWVRKDITRLDANAKPDRRLMDIARKILVANEGLVVDLDGHHDVMNLAINDPVGMMTQTILDRLGAMNLQLKDCLPSPEPTNYFEEVLGKEEFLKGQINIFSNLAYLYSIDPDWVSEKMLPLLNVAKSKYSKYYWQAYLWNPRITADLAIELKTFMLAVIKSNDFERGSVEGLANIFTYMCIEYKTIFDIDEKIAALRDFGQEGLVYVSDYLSRSISEIEPGEGGYYKHRIKPFLLSCWPKGIDFKSPEIASNLALMALEDEAIFDEALNDIEPMLVKVDHHFIVMDKLKGTSLPEKSPFNTLKLMDRTFNSGNTYDLDIVSGLLERLKESERSIDSDARYKRMHEVVIKRG